MSNKKHSPQHLGIKEQSLDTQDPEKVLRLAQKLKAQLESFKDENSLSSELYEFSEELIEQFSPNIKANKQPLKSILP